MTIKSDKWIRRMATEQGMIDPFEPNQIKEIDGRRVISYGTSSYGYDIRCADEFKLFTNINSTIVDPKDFDSKNFVDIKGDHVIVPPNSFALARTVEYFRIPRSILTICLGKSTYARCFSADTRVVLTDGTRPTLEEMAQRAEKGEAFRGYGIDPSGTIISVLLQHPRYLGRDSLLEIELDNKRLIHCTPDHRFKMSDGRMEEAQHLRPGSLLLGLTKAPVQQPETASSLAGTIRRPSQLQGLSSLSPLYSHVRRAKVPVGSAKPHRAIRRVVAIRELPGDHDVYCLTVPETANFALDAGVFTSNCGIIVNVTPFEPEWEGYVTLEFSNTTPLPAKIYANEGVAQVLFFEADDICEISYKDRGGKYQGQRGVTPPRL
jgi:deoxycytidine triphosphate deaminase